MGDRMRVLAGLKPTVLARLEKKGEIVIELISYQGVYNVLHTSTGEKIFLTDDLYEELKRGTEGIIAEVISRDVSHVRVSLDHVDEREIQRARIKVRFLRYGRIKEVRSGEGSVAVEVFNFGHPIVL